MKTYFRPIVQFGPTRPPGAMPVAGGPGWWLHAEVLQRDKAPELVVASEVPDHWLTALTTERPPVAGVSMERPRIMGILNTTPDSFSDGGMHQSIATATDRGLEVAGEGADILDIGGESTRPGAREVALADEIARTAPIISALRQAGVTVPISIDTRKAGVARAALDAGAGLVNDVSGFAFDPELAPLCAAREAPVCVMHSVATPETMQDDPRYDDVLLDVFDHLAERLAALEAGGIPRARIIADPGIGFGKTMGHNLALLRRISLFHGLGVPILLGVSRKGFIGALSGVSQATDRGPGSVGAGLAALGQGVQILRVHDVALHLQAIACWRAVVAEGDT